MWSMSPCVTRIAATVPSNDTPDAPGSITIASRASGSARTPAASRPAPATSRGSTRASGTRSRPTAVRGSSCCSHRGPARPLPQLAVADASPVRAIREPVDEEEHRHEHRRVENGYAEARDHRRRMLAEREEDVEERCEEQRARGGTAPRRRLHLADRPARARRRLRGALLLLLCARDCLDGRFVALLVDLDELPLVPLELLAPPPLLLRGHV